MFLIERMQRYENVYDNIVTCRLPIVIKCNIRNFNKVIRKLPRPYCPELWHILRSTMFTTIMEMEGAVFGYQAHGNIYYILKSTEEDSPGPYGSKIQKIGSVASSLTTLNFLKQYLASDDQPDIIGEAVFESLVFPLPSTTEVCNYLIAQQQQGYHSAISVTAEEEISRIVENTDFLNRKSVNEKKEILQTECGIVFDNQYKQYFRLGSIAFKAPKISSQEIIRKKWILEENAPNFIDQKDFIGNIIRTGQDVLVPERDLSELPPKTLV